MLFFFPSKMAAMAPEDHEVEEKLALMLARRTEYRTELERKSRSALQSLVKRSYGDYGIKANLKSSEIIEKILIIEYDLHEHAHGGVSDDERDEYYTTYIETMEAVRLLMKKSEFGAKCILDCVMQVEAELRVLVKQSVDVKAVQGNVIGKIESVKANEAELQDKTAEVAAPTAKPAVTVEPVKPSGGKIVQWVGKVLSVEDKKGFIDGRSEHGGHDERCFFYPQDLVHTLKKGDQVRFHVDLTAKRRDHHHLKACKVVREEANPQQARTKKAPELYSQVAKTADARRIKSMETTIYELRRLLDASYRPQAPVNGSWKWRGGWRW